MSGRDQTVTIVVHHSVDGSHPTDQLAHEAVVFAQISVGRRSGRSRGQRHQPNSPRRCVCAAVWQLSGCRIISWIAGTDGGIASEEEREGVRVGANGPADNHRKRRLESAVTGSHSLAGAGHIDPRRGLEVKLSRCTEWKGGVIRTSGEPESAFRSHSLRRRLAQMSRRAAGAGAPLALHLDCPSPRLKTAPAPFSTSTAASLHSRPHSSESILSPIHTSGQSPVLTQNPMDVPCLPS